MPMISGWWLLATFWIGGCLGILLSALLHIVRRGDDLEEQVASRGSSVLPAGLQLRGFNQPEREPMTGGGIALAESLEEEFDSDLLRNA